MTETTTQIDQMATVMVPVSDQDRAIDFYVEKLGFEKRADIAFGEQGAGRWIEVGLPGAQTTIALTPERGEWVVGRMTGVSLTTGDIDTLHARLRDAGVDVGIILELQGEMRLLDVYDPDGNRIQLAQEL